LGGSVAGHHNTGQAALYTYERFRRGDVLGTLAALRVARVALRAVARRRVRGVPPPALPHPILLFPSRCCWPNFASHSKLLKPQPPRGRETWIARAAVWVRDRTNDHVRRVTDSAATPSVRVDSRGGGAGRPDHQPLTELQQRVLRMPTPIRSRGAQVFYFFANPPAPRHTAHHPTPHTGRGRTSLLLLDARPPPTALRAVSEDGAPASFPDAKDSPIPPPSRREAAGVRRRLFCDRPSFVGVLCAFLSC
jgi:hypothetical protein